MVAVALPLVPIGAGVALSAATFVLGSAAYIAQQVHGFRAPLPPLTGSRGKAGDKTLQELIADAIAGARIPIALPPNPLGPNGSWGVIGLVALAGLIGRGLSQLWGLFNSKGDPASTDPAGWVQLGQASNLSFFGTYDLTHTHTRCDGATDPVPENSTSTYYTIPAGFGGITSYRVNPGITGSVLTPCGPPGIYESNFIELEVAYPDGTTARQVIASFNSLTSWDRYSTETAWKLNLGRQIDQGPVEPAFPEVEPPASVPDPKPLPELPALPAVSPVQPVPLVVPVPGESPTPKAPGLPALPSSIPVSPSVQPGVLPIPGATPTEHGVLVPPAPLPVVITPTDHHFPVPGGLPVTGNGPQATVQAIAQELGRQEQKLARLLDPGPGGPGDGTDRQQLLEQRVQAITEFLTSITAAGEYAISSPCVLDEEGNRVETAVQYSGALDSLGVISNKIDALAELLQAHKDLRQPICRQTPAQGQAVTVNFVQVD
jgi:hypothetical protein